MKYLYVKKEKSIFINVNFFIPTTIFYKMQFTYNSCFYRTKIPHVINLYLNVKVGVVSITLTFNLGRKKNIMILT